MIALVTIWAFAEALLWFVVADVPISAIGLTRGFGRAARASLAAALASAAGGLVMLRWTTAAPQASRAALDLVPGISAVMIDMTATAWRLDGFPAMLAASFAGVPYKLFAHSAGLAATAPGAFFLPSVAARLPRFLAVSTISALLGPVVRRHLASRQIVFAFTGFWMLFYTAYFLTISGR